MYINFTWEAKTKRKLPYSTVEILNTSERFEFKDWAHIRRTNLFHVSSDGDDEVRFEAHAVNSLTEFFSSDMDFVFTRDSGRWTLSGEASDGYPAISVHHYSNNNPFGKCVAYLKGGPGGDSAPEVGDHSIKNNAGGCPDSRN